MPKLVFLAIGVPFLLVLLGVFVLNAADFIRFRLAVRRATHLSEAQLMAIGDRCRAVDNHYELENGRWPAEFDALKPSSVSLFPGSSSALLYSVGDVYLRVAIRTSANDQSVEYSTNSAGQQETITIWHRNTVVAESLSPPNRLVTIWSNEQDGRKWIVLRNAIVVIESRSNFVGGTDRILARRRLDPKNRARLEETIRDVRSRAGGFAFLGPGTDGLQLGIHFSISGDRGPDDIRLSNAWSEDVAPLIRLVSELAPQGYSVEFETLLTRSNFGSEPVRVEFLRSLYDEHPTMPVWCVWRRVARYFTWQSV